METELEGRLTWGKLKEIVEAAGAKDDTPIGYIDISAYDICIYADINKNGDLEVTG